MGEAIIGF